MDVLWALLLMLVLMLGWVLTALGLPGTWLMVAAAAVYAALMPVGGPAAISWGVVLAMGLLALAGEAVEFAAGAWGAVKGGGSKRGAALALLGSGAGGILGLFVGLPVPVVGSLLAAVLFASAGAMLGAVAGESWKGRDMGQGWRVGKAAFWGRLWGTAAKVGIGTVMLIVAIAALVW